MSDKVPTPPTPPTDGERPEAPDESNPLEAFTIDELMTEVRKRTSTGTILTITERGGTDLFEKYWRFWGNPNAIVGQLSIALHLATVQGAAQMMAQEERKRDAEDIEGA